MDGCLVAPDQHHTGASNRHSHRGIGEVPVLASFREAVLGLIGELDSGVREPGVGGQHEDGVDRPARPSLRYRAGAQRFQTPVTVFTVNTAASAVAPTRWPVLAHSGAPE